MTLLKSASSDNFAEFRQSPVTKRWVLVNPGRAKRPEEYDQSKKKREVDPGASGCPFCAGNEHMTPKTALIISDKKNTNEWVVRSIPNKYPAVIQEDLQSEVEEVDRFHVKQPATGLHEVIVTRDHERHVAELPIDDVDSMLQAYQMRINEIKKSKEIEYVLIFQNRGDEAGASVVHPHSQLIALNHVPDYPKMELENMGEYYDSHKKSLIQDLIHEEQELGVRIIMETDNFIVYAPYASRFAFKVWLLPKNSMSQFEELPDDLRRECAALLKKYLQRLDERLGEPSYNYYLHTLPVNGRFSTYTKQYHWHFTIFPRLGTWAGFEFGSGTVINEMPPERAAAFLK
jgi:UDPglucose--hexose-1-phosphate uridylyltransferase